VKLKKFSKRYLVIFAGLIILIIFLYPKDVGSTTLTFVGDIMLSRDVGKIINKYNPEFPFLKIQDSISKADIAFANLESPISSRGEKLEKKYTFRADPKVIDGLNFAGFDVLSLANNHALDYGTIVLEDTLEILSENNMNYIGIKQESEINSDPLIIEKNGVKFAFLAYYDIDHMKNVYKFNRDWYPQPRILNEESLIKDIQNTKNKADIIIISFHWGDEYNFIHNKRQEKIAHLAIDNDANIIIGHHPHVLQEIEEYKEGLIAYSLGNFIFDQWSHEGVKDSVILEVEIRDKRIHDYKIKLIYINDEFQAVLK